MDDFNDNVQQLVHIRIQQRNGKKSITTINGIDDKYDYNKLLKVFKLEFACNGCIVKNKEYGEIIQLQGDKRYEVKKFLVDVKIINEKFVKIHGF